MLADRDLEMFFRHAQAYSLVPLPSSQKKTSPRSCWPFSSSPIVSERYGPDLSWLDLQSCLAKPDLDLLTPNWPADAWAINANGYVPCDFIVACYSAIADQYQHLQGQYCSALSWNWMHEQLPPFLSVSLSTQTLKLHLSTATSTWEVLKFIHCSFLSLSLAFRNWLSWQTTLNSASK